MDIKVDIPDNPARSLGTTGEIERRALEALALEEYKVGHLTRAELRRLLGFGSRDALDRFLKAHDVSHNLDDAEEERQDLKEVLPDQASREKARRAAANIIARRKGVTLGGLSIKDLMNEGRP
jgi:hypothetical protein